MFDTGGTNATRHTFDQMKIIIQSLLSCELGISTEKLGILSFTSLQFSAQSALVASRNCIYVFNVFCSFQEMLSFIFAFVS